MGVCCNPGDVGMLVEQVLELIGVVGRTPHERREPLRLPRRAPEPPRSMTVRRQDEAILVRMTRGER